MHKQLILIITLSLTSAYALADSTEWEEAKIYSKITANESAIVGLDSRVQTNSNGIQSLQTQIQNLPTGGGAGAPDPQTQVNATAIGNLGTQVQTNTTTIGNVNTQIQANTTGISGVSAEAQANTAANATQALQIQANTSDIGVLTTGAQTLQGSVDNLSVQVGTVQADAVNLSAQVQTNGSNIANNSSRLSILEAGGGTGGGTTPPPPPANIDFTLYVPTVTSKEFKIINGAACTISKQQIARTTTPTGTDILITETLTNGFQNCTTFEYGQVLTANALSTVSFANVTLNQRFTFDQPGELLTNSMEVGKSFGFAVFATNFPALATVQKSTLLGIESVTVPFGTFNNCLKMHTQTTSSMFNDVEQISWICPGLGEVRRIHMDKGISKTSIYNLTNAL